MPCKICKDNFFCWICPKIFSLEIKTFFFSAAKLEGRLLVTSTVGRWVVVVVVVDVVFDDAVIVVDTGNGWTRRRKSLVHDGVFMQKSTKWPPLPDDQLWAGVNRQQRRQLAGRRRSQEVGRVLGAGESNPAPPRPLCERTTLDLSVVLVTSVATVCLFVFSSRQPNQSTNHRCQSKPCFLSVSLFSSRSQVESKSLIYFRFILIRALFSFCVIFKNVSFIFWCFFENSFDPTSTKKWPNLFSSNCLKIENRTRCCFVFFNVWDKSA